MPVLVTVPERQYNAGEYETPPSIELNSDWSRVRVKLSRANWPETALISFEAWYSTDGLNWRRVGAATAEGGEVLDHLGEVATHSWFNIPLPPEDFGLLTRQLKAKVSSSEGLRSEITVEAF